MNNMSTESNASPGGLIPRIVQLFLTSQLSIILIIAALGLGIAAILVTPREEEPQIVVPLADVFVHAPGANPEEIEKLVATPLERLLWQIDGVEYVYSMSRQDMAVVTVRFFVGQDREKSLIKLHNKITMNIDQVPPIVQNWVIKPVEIDDVSIVNATLYSERHSDYELRRIGEEVLQRLSAVKDLSRTEIVGGRRREIRVALQPERMTAHEVTLMETVAALRGADTSVTAGRFNRFNREFSVTSNAFFNSADEVARLMVGVHRDQPVYLRDIAEVRDGPEEPRHYSRISFSETYRKAQGLPPTPEDFPAVTLALAKKKGTNAVDVARNVLQELEALKATVIPDGVRVEITRNYGHTAQQKVNGLLSSLAFAVISVVVLLAITLGWREAMVVALAVPVSFALALFVNFLLGYTINRVTLFALILSLGLVVDDPITNVDNIQRHILLGRRKPAAATLAAVNEVLPPVIMSTLAIIICFTPLFFITGMMGPYMAPMAANVPITVIFSTFCALTIVPWLAHHLLKNTPPRRQTDENKNTPSRISRFYRWVVSPFLDSRRNRYLLLLLILLLLVAAALLALFRMVPLKMLPFDNKNEFQIVVDMPEGTALEHTDQVVQALEVFLQQVPEVTSIVSYTGIAAPMDFNGLVRHYYLRQGGHVADMRVNLLDKSERSQQSHAIVLRLRTALEAIAARTGATFKIVEVPPGPPVLSTIVAELYGSPDMPYDDLVAAAAHIRGIMAEEPFVVDIDDMVEAERTKIDFLIDKEKAALHGISPTVITQALQTALSGATPVTVHTPGERQPLMVRTILPRDKRSGAVALSQITVKTSAGGLVPLAELTRAISMPEPQPVYHKNLERVVYVLAEMAGRAPAEAVLDMQKKLVDQPAPAGVRVQWAGEGEWQITLRVFRDMGIAFAAALMGIYILMIVETGSFSMPLLIMMAIPLTLIGAMPGFWLLNLITGHPVGGFDNPVFFTATGMIGMIALGGIVIRNALVLIEFIQDAVKEGLPLREAILRSGAIRMRPILLTATTTAIGAWPITLDPVFSGLAWTLIFGLLASTLFTLLVIPVAYYALFRPRAS
jgi:multidrug efflux pump subunit AcrB